MAKPSERTGTNPHNVSLPRFGEVLIRSRGKLPHWEKEAGLYFVTFHLADSLPQAVLEKIVERHRILESAQRTGAHLLPEQEVLLAEYSPRRIEEFFDRGAGGCDLADPRLARAMVEALHYWHGKRYRLLAWCVMPNHVHVVAQLFCGEELSGVVKGWKLHVSRAANQVLGRKGRFWQREYYDRLIRGEEELGRAVRYVLENPAKAGLRDWGWVGGAGLETRTTAGLETGATD